MTNSKYHGKWEDADGNAVHTDGSYPQAQTWDRWYPVYAESRVRGSKYTPYTGSSAWVTEANHYMASEARANFEKRS